MRRVCVIGAGAAGLVSLRHLASRPGDFEAVAFEKMSVVGGTWVYSERVGTDENGLPLHSSMYSGLMTNLPKKVMEFPDFAFPESLPSFLTHTQVLQYLEDYADNFKLRTHIKFNTIVDNVTNDGDKWTVVTKDALDKQITPQTHEFDAVIVCNGHYSVPLVPVIEGIDQFSGRVLHSHDFRHAEDFRGDAVLCLGASSSGVDIAMHLAPFAKQVYLSHRKRPRESLLPSNVKQTTAVIRLQDGNTAILSDGDSVKIDVLLYCTGYRYAFPFFDDGDGDASGGDSSGGVMRLVGERVTPLYKHLLHALHPRSLAFIGLTKVVVPFPMFHFQVLYALAAIDGSLRLPARDERLRETEDDYQRRLADGLPHRYAHHMEELQWAYNDEMAAAVGRPPLAGAVSELYRESRRRHRADPEHYKYTTLETLDDVGDNTAAAH